MTLIGFLWQILWIDKEEWRMGMLASYHALTDEQMTQAKEILSSSSDDSAIDFMEFVNEFDDTEHYADLDKLCDGLYFLLTRFGRAQSQSNNQTPAQIAMYQGFFGQDTLTSEFALSMPIRFLDKSKVADVVLALERIDIDSLLADVDFLDFDKADIYPNFWGNLDDKQKMCAMLKDCFAEFKNFYQTT